MVPTMLGRIQTRIFLLAVVGSLVTLVLTPLLPLPGAMRDQYRATYIVLATVAVIGVLWEALYHLLMQWRWEKDWPTLYALITCVPEGVLIWLLLQAGAIPGIAAPPPLAAFAIHFLVVWLAVWLVSQGPMRVPFIRWRFHGGRIL